jgi:hypothetical protein
VFVVTKTNQESSDKGRSSVETPTDSNLLEILEKIRAKIRDRGASTIIGLGRHFRIVDDTGFFTENKGFKLMDITGMGI